MREKVEVSPGELHRGTSFPDFYSIDSPGQMTIL